MIRDNIYEEMETKEQVTLIQQASSLAESIEALSSHEDPPSHREVSPELDELEELVPDFSTWQYSLS